MRTNAVNATKNTKKTAFIKIVGLMLAAALATLAVSSLSGCSYIESKVNDLKGSLVGVTFNIETYDNYGALTMQTSGDKITLSGNRIKEPTYTDDGIGYSYDLSSVVTVTIDGHELETCGDTVVFAETGLEKELDFTTVDFIQSHETGAITENTVFAYTINRYENLFGKSRVIVIKSQMGQPLCAYSGDKVYYEVCDDLPKTTKLMVDGKALYIHRANFQIIDKALL